MKNYTKITAKEIQFIKKKQKSNQMIFALLFKHYQYNYTFLDDLSQIPKRTINKIAKILNIPAKLSTVSSRTYDNFYASIRSYFKRSTSTTQYYGELKNWIQNTLLPNNHLTHDEIRDRATCYCKEQGVEYITGKMIIRIIKDAFNSYEKNLFLNIKNSLSSEQEAKLNGLLISYKDGISYLGWINKNFSNPSLDSMMNLITQLEFINELAINLPLLNILPKKRILYYADKFGYLVRLRPKRP